MIQHSFPTRRSSDLFAAEAVAHAAPDGYTLLLGNNGILATNRAAVALLEQSGYHSIRHFFRMAIELTEPPPEPQWPDGLTPRRFDREHAKAFQAASEDAFAEEWGHQPEPFDQWRRRREGSR